MKLKIFLLSIVLFLTACTTESDPAPQCTTKAITYQEFKDNYKPEDKAANPEAHKKQDFLFDGEIRGTEATSNTHFKGSAFDNQQIQQREIVETVQTYDKK